MTTTAIHAVGFCAHYSRQGDWAFQLALDMARAENLQLNIFHFFSDPYGEEKGATVPAGASERERWIVEREKQLRFYYDDKLGDYLNAGFRLCEENGWTELHRCMCKREFQILLLAFPGYEARFAGRPLTSFAYAFACPVVLVGPTRPDELYLNNPAALLADRLPLGGLRWSRLDDGGRVGSAEGSAVAHIIPEGYNHP